MIAGESSNSPQPAVFDLVFCQSNQYCSIKHSSSVFVFRQKRCSIWVISLRANFGNLLSLLPTTSVFSVIWASFKVIRWLATGWYIWEVFLRYRVEKISHMKGRWNQSNCLPNNTFVFFVNLNSSVLEIEEQWLIYKNNWNNVKIELLRRLSCLLKHSVYW